MATYYDIKCLPEVNKVDADKVNELAKSMLANGWQGAPILYFPDKGLVTGSHRKAALDQINARLESRELTADEEDRAVELLWDDIALDVSEYVEDWCEENDCSWDDIRFDQLSDIFEGTEIEQYKDELIEW